MNRKLIASALPLFLLVSASTALAQLHAAKDGPVAYGHHHINATNIAEHRKFFADLGGSPMTLAGREIVKFPNVLVFIRQQNPTGGTIGTTVNHLGFSVPDVAQAVKKLRANGYRMVTGEEVPSEWAVKDDVAVVPDRNLAIAMVMGPDDLKVELVEAKEQKTPVALHHVHFFGPQNQDMRAWYMKVFGAKEGAPNPRYVAAILPGVALNFAPSTTPVVGNQGRVVDHIGFEIDNLPQFLKKVGAMGIKPVNVRDVPDLNVSIAFITDPWGTYIELTEGLDKIR